MARLATRTLRPDGLRIYFSLNCRQQFSMFVVVVMIHKNRMYLCRWSGVVVHTFDYPKVEKSRPTFAVNSRRSSRIRSTHPPPCSCTTSDRMKVKSNATKRLMLREEA
jgi:hypothetical protein